MIKDIAFFAYSVRDVPRARDFYRDVLGLQAGDSFGDHWVEFDVGNTTFGIGNGEPLGITPGSSFAATFEVDDVAAERDRLLARGIAVTAAAAPLSASSPGPLPPRASVERCKSRWASMLCRAASKLNAADVLPAAPEMATASEPVSPWLAEGNDG